MRRTTALTALLALLAICCPGTSSAQDLSERERTRLREGFRLIQAVESRWSGWRTAPRAVLFVKDGHEFLIGHPDPTEDFQASGIAPIEGHDVLIRDRVFAPDLLATFPAVAGVPTVVIGTPERTGLTSTRWILTLVHEHFHQFQMSRPAYYDGVERLDLSGGDETGMWMLDYPFPYSSPPVGAEVNELGALAKDLAEGHRLPGSDDNALSDYFEQRRVVARVVEPGDYRYLSFQVWQEGIARHAEIDAARHGDDVFEVSQEFRDLPDFIPLDRAADELWAETLSALASDLGGAGRLYFYALGALDGAILDLFRPGWRSRYTSEMFTLDRHFEPSRRPR